MRAAGSSGLAERRGLDRACPHLVAEREAEAGTFRQPHAAVVNVDAVLVERRFVRFPREDELTLDADQVKRLSAGLPLDEPTGSQGSPSAVPPREAKPAKERPATGIVPPMPPRPLTQE